MTQAKERAIEVIQNAADEWEKDRAAHKSLREEKDKAIDAARASSIQSGAGIAELSKQMAALMQQGKNAEAMEIHAKIMSMGTALMNNEAAQNPAYAAMTQVGTSAQGAQSGGDNNTSIDSIKAYLAKNHRGIGSNNPLPLKASIELGDMAKSESGWQQLLKAVNNGSNYVALDLSDSTLQGSEFDPNKDIVEGKSWIVSIALPRAANNLSGEFKFFNSLKAVSAEVVTAIGAKAFFNCKDLEKVDFPAAASIGDEAFVECKYLTDVNIPAAAGIGDRAFLNCVNLKSVNFPLAAGIGEAVFFNCSDLREAHFPMLNSMGEAAFDNCHYELRLAKILARIDSETDTAPIRAAPITAAAPAKINTDARRESNTMKIINHNIEKLKAAKKAKAEGESIGMTIDNDPEHNAMKIMQDNIRRQEEAKKAEAERKSNRAKKIEAAAFTDVSGSFKMARMDLVTDNGEGLMVYKLTGKYDKRGAEVLIPVQLNDNPVTVIGEEAFLEKREIDSIFIPRYVTTIEASAFESCGSLTYINIPRRVTGIGKRAFRYCSKLQSIIIPPGVAGIEEAVFHGCDAFTDITIPDSVTSIGASAFKDCTKLTNITIPDSVTSIGDFAFEDCSNLASITLPKNLTNIDRGVFKQCKSLTNITIPDGVTSIGDDAFEHCTGLTGIAIPNSVNSIESSAFAYCENLASLTIPEGVTVIGSSAFKNCVKLEKITLPSSLIYIDDMAFDKCLKLKEITIPDSVLIIYEYTFHRCGALKRVSLSHKTKMGRRGLSEEIELIYRD